MRVPPSLGRPGRGRGGDRPPTLPIARQGVVAGLGLSIAAMVVAAAGGLPPVAGPLLQEGIDVAVILKALRALGAPHP